MAKKAKRSLRSARATKTPPTKPLDVEGSAPTVVDLVDDAKTPEPPKRRPGRPSNQELAQRKKQELVDGAVTEEEFRPVTEGLLGALCQMAKGTPPLDPEVNIVNKSATVVANKYGFGNKPELALVLSVMFVVGKSRQRRIDAEAKEPKRAAIRVRDTGKEEQRENEPVSPDAQVVGALSGL